MDYTQIKDLPMTLTVNDLTKILRVGRNTAYRLVQEGAIRSIRFGRKIMIPRDAVQDFLLSSNNAVFSVEKEG